MSAPGKTRLLFVIGHLVQSGSERFTYEMCKAIDRERFEVEVLTKWRVRPDDFYYLQLLELGVPVHRRLPLALNRMQRHARPVYLALRPLLELGHRLWSRLVLGGLLDRFDVINCVQIENYYLLQPLLKNNDRVVTYLMNNAFQYAFNPYLDCEPGRKYRFVYSDPTVIADYASAPCAGAEGRFLPLVLDLSGTSDLSTASKAAGPHDIGVFMRLSPERPISGIFQAFAELARGTDVRLRVWGRGDQRQFAGELTALGIADKVIFEEHTSSIETTLREGNLSLVWLTSNGRALGYASVEIASFGFPMLFWNLSAERDEEVAAATGGAIQAFQKPTDLARATAELIADYSRRIATGRKLRQYVLATYDVGRHVGDLEQYLLSVAVEARR